MPWHSKLAKPEGVDKRSMPGVGLEPTQYCYRGILSPVRLPFRHPGLVIHTLPRQVSLFSKYKTSVPEEPISSIIPESAIEDEMI
jgi:hypothetical protein